MSVGPRIVFARFVDGNSPKLQPWISHLRQSLRLDATTPTPVVGSLELGAVVWQLVSGNNRQLARSSRIFDSFERASADAQRAIVLADRLEVTYSSEQKRGLYGWFASIDGEPAMTSARWYESERDRMRSLALAIPSTAAAVLHQGSRLVDVSLTGGAT